jgi:hypothetical protein
MDNAQAGFRADPRCRFGQTITAPRRVIEAVGCLGGGWCAKVLKMVGPGIGTT